MSSEGSRHIPVMTREVVTALEAEAGGVFLDCTLGGGGHTVAILEAHRENKVFALDRDSRAIRRAERLVERFEGRLMIQQGTFSDLSDLFPGQSFSGIVADLGVSTDQLYEERGFSFQDSESLDMRMDEQQARSAQAIVNESEPRELLRYLREGGVGREARLVADAIIGARPIDSAAALAQVVSGALHGKGIGKKTNPATVVFQAIRIAVNDELNQIHALMQAIPKRIASGGRAAIISFHSLEDKVVARAMRSWEGASGAPALWPGGKSAECLGKLVTRKATVPSEEEVSENPSARSARLRVFVFNERSG